MRLLLADSQQQPLLVFFLELFLDFAAMLASLEVVVVFAGAAATTGCEAGVGTKPDITGAATGAWYCMTMEGAD